MASMSRRAHGRRRPGSPSLYANAPEAVASKEFGCAAVALAGYGRWGRTLARAAAASPVLDLAVIVDPNPAARAAARRAQPAVPVFGELAAALEAVPVEAVIVASPPTLLAATAAAALHAGRHVLVEKPGATSAAGLRALAALAAAQRLTLMVDLPALFGPLHRGLVAALTQGRIGRPQSWRSARVNAGIGQPGIGVLEDLAIHDLAVLDTILGVPPSTVTLVERRAGAGGRLVRGVLRLAYPTGFEAVVEADWAGTVRVRRAVLQGSCGRLVRDEVVGGAGLVLAPGGRRMAAQAGPGSAEEPLALVLAAFAAALRGRGANPVSAQRAARLLDVIEAAVPVLPLAASA